MRGTPFYAWLRRYAPLCWGAENGYQFEGMGFWILDSGVTGFSNQLSRAEMLIRG